MRTPILWLLGLVAATVVAAIVNVVIRYRKGERFSRTGLVVCLIPALILLGLFYSLAVHMHQSLGNWPASIGERGFPSALVLHSSIAVNYSGIIYLTLLVWPAIFSLCVLVPAWRRLGDYVGLYGLAVISGIGLMLLAPAPFLTWWWD